MASNVFSGQSLKYISCNWQDKKNRQLEKGFPFDGRVSGYDTNLRWKSAWPQDFQYPDEIKSIRFVVQKPDP